MAAHEIRTPITVIKAQAQLAERFHAQGKLQGEILERTLRTFVHESDRLARLCSDLLDVARIDNGSFEVQSGTFDLTRLASEVVVRMNDVAHLSDGHLVRLHSANTPILVSGDRPRTERVLYSLLSNAVRYSPHGGEIDVVVREAHGEATLSVKDRGLGIPVDKISRVFERYYQAHVTGLRGPAGLGLGLYLSREIVKRMGGKISATSDGPGCGSEFSFTLPVVNAVSIEGAANE